MSQEGSYKKLNSKSSSVYDVESTRVDEDNLGKAKAIYKSSITFDEQDFQIPGDNLEVKDSLSDYELIQNVLGKTTTKNWNWVYCKN